MPRETEPSLNEQAFLRAALSQSQRIDGRALQDYRPLSLTFSDTPGLAEVALGRTRVAVRVSSTVTTPFPDRKFDGVFTLGVELSPLASPAFEAGGSRGAGGGGGSANDAELLLGRLLEKTIRRSGALDTESLCIVAGAKCFAVRADVHVLDFDGGLVDAACVGVVAALLHYRRPEVEVQGEQVRVFDVREREPVRLNMNHVPFCVSFSIFRNVDEGTAVVGKGGTGFAGDGEEIVVVDANVLEEQCRDAELVIGMNRYGEVVQIAKHGGYPIEPLAVMKCTTIALEKVKWLHSFVMGKLEEDEKKQNADGVLAELRAENERVIPG